MAHMNLKVVSAWYPILSFPLYHYNMMTKGVYRFLGPL